MNQGRPLPAAPRVAGAFFRVTWTCAAALRATRGQARRAEAAEAAARRCPEVAAAAAARRCPEVAAAAAAAVARRMPLGAAGGVAEAEVRLQTPALPAAAAVAAAAAAAAESGLVRWRRMCAVVPGEEAFHRHLEVLSPMRRGALRMRVAARGGKPRPPRLLSLA